MMPQQIEIPLSLIKPDAAGVFKTQGIPSGTEAPPRVKQLYDKAEALFLNLAVPAAIKADISSEAFGEIYAVSGNNELRTPLSAIFPRARNLALFAFTLGAAISREIENQFRSNGLAVGYMLDAIASFSASKAAEAAADIYLADLQANGEAGANTRVLMYSPGYCGWHISGQKPLFTYLKPELIGISLTDSFLMVPLKSISGLLVSGDTSIHLFKNNFPFCSACTSRTCLDRIKMKLGN